jgi:hypothetical protein
MEKKKKTVDYWHTNKTQSAGVLATQYSTTEVEEIFARQIRSGMQ